MDLLRDIPDTDMGSPLISVNVIQRDMELKTRFPTANVPLTFYTAVLMEQVKVLT